MLLIECLEEKRWFPKALYVVGASAGSLLLALIMDPSAVVQGLSGLSGIAHGLMAIAALEMLRHRVQRKWGWISLLTVVGKSAYELWTGQVLFEFIHMGMCGQPMAACHAGGVLGALTVFLMIHIRPKGFVFSKINRGSKTSPASPRPATQSRLGVAIQILARVLYRVRYHGLEHIPAKGAAVLVCNHVSYIDWLIISSASRRKVHFVMHASIYRMPIIHWILRLAKVIPIESGRKNPAALRAAFDQIEQILRSGGLVCIFPEGRLTRTGRINAFRPGIEHIIRNTPVPVVPLALGGLWGSFFSHKNSKSMQCRPLETRTRVALTVGRKVDPCMATAHYLRTTVQKLHGEIA